MVWSRGLTRHTSSVGVAEPDLCVDHAEYITAQKQTHDGCRSPRLGFDFPWSDQRVEQLTIAKDEYPCAVGLSRFAANKFSLGCVCAGVQAETRAVFCTGPWGSSDWIEYTVDVGGVKHLCQRTGVRAENRRELQEVLTQNGASFCWAAPCRRLIWSAVRG